jgi:hypothetical protein
MKYLNHFVGFMVLVLFSFSFICLVFNFLDFGLTETNILTLVLQEGSTIDKVAMDTPRIWPSGVAQIVSIIGSALAVYTALTKIGGVSPKVRVLSSLSAAAAITGTIIFYTALEYSLWFNRIMCKLTRLNKGKSWPSIDVEVNKDSEETINKFAEEYLKQNIDATVKAKVSEVLESLSKKFIPDFPDFTNFDFSRLPGNLADLLFNVVFSILKPVSATGYFDDLIGQHIIILVSLLIIAVFITLLFGFFLFNLVIYINKEYLINRFNNRFIRFYLTFQSRLIKYSLI